MYQSSSASAAALKNDHVPANPNLLVGHLNYFRPPIYFSEEKVAGAGQCGFITLGIDSSHLRDSLLPLKDRLEARAFIAEEIREAFLTPTLPTTAEWTRLEITREKAQHALDEEFRRIRNLVEANNPREPALQYSIDDFILWLESVDCNDDNGELTSKKVAAKKAEDAVIDYCRCEAAYVHYINNYDNGMWLGIKSILLFAKTEGSTVYIWHKKENTHQIELMESTVAPAVPKRLIHMLNTGRFTHFNLLVERDINYRPEVFVAATPPTPVSTPTKRNGDEDVNPHPKRQRDSVSSLAACLRNESLEFLLPDNSFGEQPGHGRTYALASSQQERFKVLHYRGPEDNALTLGSVQGDYICRKKNDGQVSFIFVKEVDSANFQEYLRQHGKAWLQQIVKYHCNTQGQSMPIEFIFSFANVVDEKEILKEIGGFLQSPEFKRMMAEIAASNLVPFVIKDGLTQKPFPNFRLCYRHGGGVTLSPVYTSEDAREEYSPTKLKYQFVPRVRPSKVSSFSSRMDRHELQEFNERFIVLLEKQKEFIAQNPLYHLCSDPERSIVEQGKYFLPAELVRIREFYANLIRELNELAQKFRAFKEPSQFISAAFQAECLGLSKQINDMIKAINLLTDKFNRLEEMYLGKMPLRAEATAKFSANGGEIREKFKAHLQVVIGDVSDEEMTAWFNSHEFTVLSAISQRMIYKLFIKQLPDDVAKLLVFYYIAEHSNKVVCDEVSKHIVLPTAVNSIFRKNDISLLDKIQALVAGFSSKNQDRVRHFGVISSQLEVQRSMLRVN